MSWSEPDEKYTLLKWRKTNELPKENDLCLVIDGGDVLAARFTHGDFFASSWRLVKNPSFWAEWPKAPVS